MSEHMPVEEEVLPWDCYYGECGHENDAECVATMTVCNTCCDVIDGEFESFVKWPCKFATSPTTETTERSTDAASS